jgi:hypothetical protein
MERQIRSLHINTEKTWRGGEQQVLYLVCSLKDMGSVPIVVCQKKSELAEKLKANGIEYYELSMRGELDILSAMSISDIVRKENIDIVHAHTSHAHSITVIASMFFKKKAKIVVSRRVDFRLKRNYFSKIKYRSIAFPTNILQSPAPLKM